ncbi:MAG: CDP-alcohol phosphatidyltransferase family protein [Holosporales bacterium]|jgi:cardiolipin synthase|nr:CDP-alcohol phosphatidyltransferase family protein [Holosporales bacterium]
MFKKNIFLKENVTIPNILTVFRIVAAPLVFYFFRKQEYFLTLLFFSAASVTDWLDGWIARTFNQQSALGKLLDPFADKMLTFFSLLALFGMTKWPSSIFFWLPVGRDFFILIGVIIAYIKKINLEIKPIFVSKLNTAFLFLFVFLDFLMHFLEKPKYVNGVGYTKLENEVFGWGIIGFLLIVPFLITTFCSLIAYAKIFFKQLNTFKEQEKNAN